MEQIVLHQNGLHIVFEINKEQEIKLLHFSALPFSEETIRSEEEKVGFNLAEISISGLDRPLERHGTKYIVTAPGYRMKYVSHHLYDNKTGKKLEIVQFDEETGIELTTHWQFYEGLPVVRMYHVVGNRGTKEQTLEYVSTFSLTGIEKEGLQKRDEKMFLSIPHNSWQREMQWQTYSLPQLGLEQSQKDWEQRSSKAIGITNTGNWSAKEYLPMGYLENRECGSNLFWQIEHNGSWHWEISDQRGHLYLNVSGPTEQESHWFKQLKPGDHFTTVPVAVGSVIGTFDDAMGALTNYRRAIRRPNKDNETLAVIFNDYMNCLGGKPTTEKEMPLIDAAAEVGCEYYCIDAGWYADGDWWDSVGEWKPSRKRFPNGLKEVMDYIRKKGMVPGVWLEIEVMGIYCKMANEVTDDWFFVRHDKRVYDRSRYQLDFRNPEVVAYANAVVDRLIREYGVGYIKMDYNIEPGIGTELHADSAGDGMLQHERAYLAWLDAVFARYPDLIIENCSSGGLRIDYAMLSRYSIQSTSDQDDYRNNAVIACNAPTGVTPEQAAVWSYPMTEGDKEEVIFNMVNAMLLRIHQSGHLSNLTEERKALVKEGITVYKRMRQHIKSAVPFWPLGLATFSDGWLALGLQCEEKAYLAVWRRKSEKDTIQIPLTHVNAGIAAVKLLYPQQEMLPYQYEKGNKKMTVSLPEENTARIFEIAYE